MNKPAGKGERLIVVNAITLNGWVNNAQLVFEAKKRTGDYHKYFFKERNVSFNQFV